MKKVGIIFVLFFSTMIIVQGQDNNSEFFDRLSKAGIALTLNKVKYDPTYYTIPYPNGDVPAGRGVCTDVIIRAYRVVGIDLQKEVHEDMKANFSKYPKKWGLKSTDKNIDHRRVPNLMFFFERKGAKLPITNKGLDYKPGDIVTWMLPGNLSHIGLVVNRKTADNKRYMIVHNIGTGQVMQDCLASWKITGHYRYKK